MSAPIKHHLQHPPLALSERDRTSPWAAPDFQTDLERCQDAIFGNHCWVCGRIKPLTSHAFATDTMALLFGRAMSPPGHLGCIAHAVGCWGYQGLLQNCAWRSAEDFDPEAGENFPTVVPIIHYLHPIKLERAGEVEGHMVVDYCIDEGHPLDIRSSVAWAVPRAGRLATEAEVIESLEQAIEIASAENHVVAEPLRFRANLLVAKLRGVDHN